MKNKFQSIFGIMAGIAIGSLSVVGANQAIQAIQNTQIKIKLNGIVQEFKDESTGETQYPITYNDRTYLPLRNVASLSGLKVDYDNESNTAILESSEKLKNTLTPYDLKEQLLLSIYGGIGDTPTQLVPEWAAYAGTATRALMVDIDKNGVPELIKFGNVYQNEDSFQIYTMNNDEPVAIAHRLNVLFNIHNIYETEDGVYVLCFKGDGPEVDWYIYKLSLNGLYLDFQEVLRDFSIYDENTEAKTGEKYYVMGKEVDKTTYLNKVAELNKIRIIDKDIFYKDDSMGSNLDYLWAEEMFVHALINNNVQVGKQYIFTHRSVDDVYSGMDIIGNSGNKLKEGEIIKIISEKPSEWFESPDTGKQARFVDYEVQRENGEIVLIGEIAGRT